MAPEEEVTVRLKAAELPDRLRGTIAPDHDVEVTVRDLGSDQTRGSVRDLLLAHFRRLDAGEREDGPTMEDAVSRVRALRDEWE